MCTASWLIHDDGYELFCNRDELNTRQRGIAPVWRERNGMRYLAPTDGDHGGSWIAVNERGLSLCLLNLYGVETASPAGRFTSRGLLLAALTHHQSPVEVARDLWSLDLNRYRPFLLLLLARQMMPLLLKWDGTQISGDVRPQMPVTTSSFDTANVIHARQRRFDELAPRDAQSLRRYHFSRDPRGGPYSVCLARADARTVSFSHISVIGNTVNFEYQPLVDTDRRTVGHPVVGAPAGRALPCAP
jgi:hypothetical protein